MACAILVNSEQHGRQLLKSFVPKLKKAGVSQKAIDTILIENPKRILTRKVGV